MRSFFTHQDGNTALHVAAMDDEYDQDTKESRVNCVQALLSHPGIDVNIKNNEGHTAMMVHMSVLHALYSSSVCIHIHVQELTTPTFHVSFITVAT